jgi:hypothetical protein
MCVAAVFGFISYKKIRQQPKFQTMYKDEQPPRVGFAVKKDKKVELEDYSRGEIRPPQYAARKQSKGKNKNKAAIVNTVSTNEKEIYASASLVKNKVRRSKKVRWESFSRAAIRPIKDIEVVAVDTVALVADK